MGVTMREDGKRAKEIILENILGQTEINTWDYDQMILSIEQEHIQKKMGHNTEEDG